MIFSLVIRPEAEQDLNEAYRWYDQQLDGLGRELIICLDAALSVIQRTPKIFPKIHKDIRRALIRRFPYGIFYILEQDKVVVLAFLHTSRDPMRFKPRT
ncbi:MAG: type II toxin-antitoxin system RelE/ParE family toxin [Candidatus Omnitrophica bacterium]|nr:type II toxin-antitoxin system RelE/ParE family toxin [Candidatus Omnitrophota bacterium]